ncbi:uncharacterized protein LOC126267304 isoform X2 [Schistocerca gregaria]|nr:uncharacterized protein LOC126267304 isoform X2 [Schistocerca gregaria]XP_049828341.1 uncharacterized protein LOC126267304 isoform X2 [Schistocerca gregaria]
MKRVTAVRNKSFKFTLGCRILVGLHSKDVDRFYDLSSSCVEVEIFSFLTRYSEGTHDKITPYFYGEKLSLDQDLVADGFPAITNKVIASVSPQGIIELKYQDGSSESSYLIRRRNSFFDLHNPDLSRLECRPKPSFEECEEFFKNYIIAFGLLHTSTFMFPFEGDSNEVRAITHEREEIYKDDNIPQMIISRRTLQVSDDDIDSAYMPHRSPADFCFTIGNLTRKDTDSKSKTQLLRWADSVQEEEHITAEEKGIHSIKSPAGAVAVRSVHSVGSYKESAHEKDGVFDITEIKKVASSSFKTVSFASLHTTASTETAPIHAED